MTPWKDSSSALDRVNRYEVESFLDLYALNIASENGFFKPSVVQSRQFADATKDPNPIHQKIDGFEQVVSPGFLQNCISIVHSKRAIRNAGLSSLDLPYSLNESEMPGFVPTGLDYLISGQFDAQTREADVEIKTLPGVVKHRLHRKLYAEKPTSGMPGINGDLIYEGRFAISGNDSISSFGKLISSVSSESNLRALAGSSSAICDAIACGKLNSVEKGAAAMYAGSQQFYLHSAGTLDLHKGINMRLYVSDRAQFGKLSAENRITVIGEDDSGRTLYHFNANLSFRKESSVNKLLERALTR